jgi:hypothetical protein
MYSVRAADPSSRARFRANLPLGSGARLIGHTGRSPTICLRMATFSSLRKRARFTLSRHWASNSRRNGLRQREKSPAAQKDTTFARKQKAPSVSRLFGFEVLTCTNPPKTERPDSNSLPSHGDGNSTANI